MKILRYVVFAAVICGLLFSTAQPLNSGGLNYTIHFLGYKCVYDSGVDGINIFYEIRDNGEVTSDLVEHQVWVDVVDETPYRFTRNHQTPLFAAHVDDNDNTWIRMRIGTSGMWVVDYRFFADCPALTATPTVTQTSTPTSTPLNTATSTVTPTASVTNTPTASPTVTNTTVENTPTSTVTINNETPTATITSFVTLQPLPSETMTPTPTLINTVVSTQTATPIVITATPTATVWEQYGILLPLIHADVKGWVAPN